jgi:uncharacterized glyoxalase superfamily protein PhnB
MTDPRPNIFPIVHYNDEPAAVAWLCDVLGFEDLLTVRDDKGEIAHCELKLGPGVIMPSGGGARWGPYVYLPETELEAHYERTRAAGAEIVRPLMKKDYGGSGYSVRDPEGNEWSFGSYYPGES